MAYETETIDAIHQRMLDASPSDIDKREGSITWDLTKPAAIELSLLYAQLDDVLRKGFADTALANGYSEYLEKRTAEMGITRKPAVKATGQVTFTGPDGTVIPSGTRVSTNDITPIYFVTTASGTINGGSITVNAEAEVGGANGNVAAGKITIVTGDLSGVVSVINSAPFNGGVDAESDQALYERYIERIQKPATSGNANQYVQWAKEVAGISDAKCYPIWNGPGTVKVVLLDTDKTAPDAAKIQEVADYIESVRPIGATVTVVGATEVPINVSATLTLANGKTLADAQTEIETGIRDYLKSLAFVDPIVRYTQIGSIISNAPSVIDYSGLTVNGGTANIQVNDGEVAVLGSVTLS